MHSSDTFQSILRFSCGFLLWTGFQAQSCAAQNSTETGREAWALPAMCSWFSHQWVHGKIFTVSAKKEFHVAIVFTDFSPWGRAHHSHSSIPVSWLSAACFWTLQPWGVECDLLPALPVHCSICQGWCIINHPFLLHCTSHLCICDRLRWAINLKDRFRFRFPRPMLGHSLVVGFITVTG